VADVEFDHPFWLFIRNPWPISAAISLRSMGPSQAGGRIILEYLSKSFDELVLGESLIPNILQVGFSHLIPAGAE